MPRNFFREVFRGEQLGTAMTGPGLPQRVRTILAGAPTKHVSRLRLFCIAILIAAAGATLGIGKLVHAQSKLAFEVASIKLLPETSTYAVGISISGTQVTASGSLKHMLTSIYGVRAYQVSGGPGWADQQLYAIVAKAEGPASPTLEEAQRMMQTLLADRFHLVVHREPREMPVYALAVDKDGLKMKPSAPEAKFHIDFGLGPVRHLKGSLAMTSLVFQFNQLLQDRPVVDRTGLTGLHEVSLEWSSTADQSTAPSIFTAVREQLGLRLDPARAAMDMLVVDSVERPGEN